MSRSVRIRDHQWHTAELRPLSLSWARLRVEISLSHSADPKGPSPCGFDMHSALLLVVLMA